MPQLEQKLKCTVPNLETDVKLLYLCWGQCMPGLQQQYATLQVLPLLALNDNLASQAFLQSMYPVFHKGQSLLQSANILQKTSFYAPQPAL